MSSRIYTKTSLTYDDVLLVPQYSEVKSRTHVDLTALVGGENKLKLKVPVFSAPMDTITQGPMALAMAEAGGMGIVHRFQSIEDRLAQLKSVYDNIKKLEGYVGVSVGLDDSLEDIAKLVEYCDLLNVDLAHAHSKHTIEFVEKLAAEFSINIMAGNVATFEGTIDLINAGADIIKVGVGSGSICSTRLVTGHGVGSVSAILAAVEAAEASSYQVSIIADGGIRGTNDIAKALAAGADAVMLGSMLAGTEETPGGWTRTVDGQRVKEYRGMASKEAQADWRGLKAGTVAEGISVAVPARGSVIDVVNDIAGALRSSFTYSGASNIAEFYNKSEFIRITPAVVAESDTHILTKR